MRYRALIPAVLAALFTAACADQRSPTDLLPETVVPSFDLLPYECSSQSQIPTLGMRGAEGPLQQHRRPRLDRQDRMAVQP
jgi:hypothetical protein